MFSYDGHILLLGIMLNISSGVSSFHTSTFHGDEGGIEYKVAHVVYYGNSYWMNPMCSVSSFVV